MRFFSLFFSLLAFVQVYAQYPKSTEITLDLLDQELTRGRYDSYEQWHVLDNMVVLTNYKASVNSLQLVSYDRELNELQRMEFECPRNTLVYTFQNQLFLVITRMYESKKPDPSKPNILEIREVNLEDLSVLDPIVFSFPAELASKPKLTFSEKMVVKRTEKAFFTDITFQEHTIMVHLQHLTSEYKIQQKIWIKNYSGEEVKTMEHVTQSFWKDLTYDNGYVYAISKDVFLPKSKVPSNKRNVNFTLCKIDSKSVEKYPLNTTGLLTLNAIFQLQSNQDVQITGMQLKENGEFQLFQQKLNSSLQLISKTEHELNQSELHVPPQKGGRFEKELKKELNALDAFYDFSRIIHHPTGLSYIVIRQQFEKVQQTNYAAKFICYSINDDGEISTPQLFHRFEYLSNSQFYYRKTNTSLQLLCDFDVFDLEYPNSPTQISSTFKFDGENELELKTMRNDQKEIKDYWYFWQYYKADTKVKVNPNLRYFRAVKATFE